MKRTPLCVAAGNGHTAVVEVLVKAGADMNKVSYVHVHVGCEEVLHVEEHVLHPQHCVLIAVYSLKWPDALVQRVFHHFRLNEIILFS